MPYSSSNLFFKHPSYAKNHFITTLDWKRPFSIKIVFVSEESKYKTNSSHAPITDGLSFQSSALVYEDSVHILANKIQRVCRRRFILMVMNQIKISACFRSLVARHRFSHGRKKICVLQRAWRRKLENRRRAAHIIMNFINCKNRWKKKIQSIVLI